jgi:hypothetical protein
MGCQWKELLINKDGGGRPEIHYTRIYSAWGRWEADGCIDAIFTVSVMQLHHDGLLDITVIHGDGTTTAAKKGGDNIGFNGHKKLKADNRDRGASHDAAPPTPPGIRVRTTAVRRIKRPPASPWKTIQDL